jgi:hypothetical protein
MARDDDKIHQSIRFPGGEVIAADDPKRFEKFAQRARSMDPEELQRLRDEGVIEGFSDVRAHGDADEREPDLSTRRGREAAGLDPDMTEKQARAELRKREGARSDTPPPTGGTSTRASDKNTAVETSARQREGTPGEQTVDSPAVGEHGGRGDADKVQTGQRPAARKGGARGRKSAKKDE